MKKIVIVIILAIGIIISGVIIINDNNRINVIKSNHDSINATLAFEYLRNVDSFTKKIEEDILALEGLTSYLSNSDNNEYVIYDNSGEYAINLSKMYIDLYESEQFLYYYRGNRTVIYEEVQSKLFELYDIYKKIINESITSEETGTNDYSNIFKLNKNVSSEICKAKIVIEKIKKETDNLTKEKIDDYIELFD